MTAFEELNGDYSQAVSAYDKARADLAKWKAVASELVKALEREAVCPGDDCDHCAEMRAALRAYRELEGAGK